MNFTINPMQSRIVFGIDAAAQLADEVTSLGRTRAMIVCTPGAVDRVQRWQNPWAMAAPASSPACRPMCR